MHLKILAQPLVFNESSLNICDEQLYTELKTLPWRRLSYNLIIIGMSRKYDGLTL